MIEPLELAKRFVHHPPSRPEVAANHTQMRLLCAELAVQITERTPPGREQSVALTKLEEVMFWCNAAIARNQFGDETTKMEKMLAEDRQQSVNPLDVAPPNETVEELRKRWEAGANITYEEAIRLAHGQ